MQELLETINSREVNTKYVALGGVQAGKPASLLLDQQMPLGLLPEPEVTAQLLDLNAVTISLLEHGSTSAL